MTKWKPNDEQRALLLRLKQEAQPNESDFARKFTIWSESKFSKILAALDPDDKRRSYFDEVKDRDGLLEAVAEFLAKLPRMRREVEEAAQRHVYELSSFTAVAKAVRSCKDRTTPERLVKVIGPTGAGKTTLRHFLVSEFKGEIPVGTVESRDAWRPTTMNLRQTCKLIVLQDICESLGLNWGEVRKNASQVGQIENILIGHCMVMRRLLFIDEAEFFSAYALNLLKLLLNKTRLVIVLACTPRAHAKWNHYYPDEADQISRRTDALVSLADVSADDVALFFEDGQFDNRKACLEYIAQEASVFGHLSLVSRVVRLLKKTSQAERAEVEAAVAAALAQMGKARVTPAVVKK